MELSYCTNVHPAEDLDGIIEQLDVHAGPVRIAAGRDVLGVGLWIPAQTAAVLAADPAARGRLSEALDRNGLTLRTINAFPYRGFHDDVVKLAVYRPDWTTPERLRFTMDCATLLAEMLPEGASGSISTLPLGWREGWDAAADAAAEASLLALRDHLRDLQNRTGRTVRIGIEPEPGCILDNVADIVAWLGARPHLVQDGLIGLCLDTCHLAVSFADPGEAVAGATAAGVRIVKVQASVALELTDPSGGAATEVLAPFAEARYVHQVRARPTGAGPGSGTVEFAADDLDEVLAAGSGWPTDRPWRVHVHIPLHATPAPPLRATTEVLLSAVSAVLQSPGGADAHLDVETYTWTVLPEALQPETLVDGIAAELRWAAAHLSHAITAPASVRTDVIGAAR
ncbi:metabolite traffic protein EboE [Microbacterium rhizomatis]|uniref:TIM barrel protein n=1 Tax=Microbacterium rhizomatis TaxID=1631477 RepID=A0A5J5IZ65_9MICO|nr:metabolite traffic protein EboE [Microbacterium rhizomatis]KAA9107616.1 TIM barrel protein [Microbacterium rhizomatis]